MKLLCAGGRNNWLSTKGYDFLHDLHDKFSFEELVNGCAGGIDLCAYEWAEEEGIPVKRFPAKWKIYGKSAGPRRNFEMAWYCSEGDIACIFPGGDGSKNMLENAVDRGMNMIDLMHREDLII